MNGHQIRYNNKFITKLILFFIVQNKQLIEDTIKYFNNLTCVQWKRRSSEDDNLPYVIFKPDSL